MRRDSVGLALGAHPRARPCEGCVQEDVMRTYCCYERGESGVSRAQTEGSGLDCLVSGESFSDCAQLSIYAFFYSPDVTTLCVGVPVVHYMLPNEHARALCCFV